jgi:NADH-quinone oxidoreductase subunit J
MEYIAGPAFSYLAATSVVCAMLAVTRRNPVHSMLWVLALFLHVAGVFVLAGAEFLAAVQVIVYAGAILVFYLFVLMLLDVADETAGPPFGRHWPLGVAAGLIFAALASYVITRQPDASSGERVSSNLATLGTVLFTQFALPFEIASLILLAAIVGAIVMAKRAES